MSAGLLRRRISPALGLAVGAVVAMAPAALAVDTNGTGGGDFSDPNTWAGGAVPTTQNLGILAGDVLTLQSGTVYDRPNQDANPWAGGLVINDGATMRMRRVYPTGDSPSLVLNGGLFSVDRLVPNNLTGTFNMDVNGGTFELRSTIAWGFPEDTTFNLNINGGRFIVTTDITSGGGTRNLNLNGGTFDFSGRSPYVPLLNWTGGTIVNAYGVNSGGTRGVLSNLPAGGVLDISDQTGDGDRDGVPDTGAQQVNLAGTAFTPSQGTVQFDVYSAVTNDSDSILGSSNNTNVPSDVIFDIGWVGGTIDPDELVGSSYQLIHNSNAVPDYSGLLASVSDTVWNDGTTAYNVSFASNLAVDGTISIASVTPVPEPVALGLLPMSMLLLSRRRSQ